MKTCFLILTTLFFLSFGTTAGELFLKNFPEQGSALETLRTGFLQEKNPDLSFWGREYPIYSDFFNQGEVVSVQVIKDRPKLNYKVWMQKQTSPLVVILPGFGVNYNGDMLTAVAEIFYRRGSHVLTISNAMNWEFVQAAGSVDAPGFVPKDAADTRRALAKIIPGLIRKHGSLISRRLLVGYSLGGLHTLFISEFERKKNILGFSKYMAINPPVDMLHALRKLDNFYRNWTTWKREDVDKTITKAIGTYLSLSRKNMSLDSRMPLTDSEARFLIGFSFRMMLRELIYSLEKSKGFGDARAQDHPLSREELYQEINRFSYFNYLCRFIQPCYSKILEREVTLAELNRATSMTRLEKSLRNNPKVRVFHNANDFLLRPKDIAWMKKTLKNRLTLFNCGGHLGNLYCGQVQKRIIKELESEKPLLITKGK